MKIWMYIFVLICWACSKPIDFELEKKSITKLIDDETKFAAAADSIGWESCWTNTDEAVFSITSANETVCWLEQHQDHFEGRTTI